mmetsp:Transcript_4181/g.10854  ORF Transcript_4181/g.10854 Transcript_4181/m.10854 type:complete len:156 (+) Transcript_4181:1181-1648(+)
MMLSALRIVPNRCAITNTVRWDPNRSRASCTLLSVIVSSAEVASSNTTSGGSFNRHRAIAARCFSPPLSLRPRSPTIVSQPSVMLSIKSRSWASRAACSRSSWVAPRRPYRMFSRIVSLNMLADWGTTPMLPRSDCCVTVRTSLPFTFTAPPRTS